jgi:hypothetical protein
MNHRDEQQIARIFRQMGEPSWWILSQLHPAEGMAGVQIIGGVDEALRRAGSPVKRLDPSTFARAIIRMEKLKLVKRLPDREVEVPVGHGATKRELRPVWIITGEGQLVLNRWQRSASALTQPRWAPGTAGT